jgi:hypothetical protein
MIWGDTEATSKTRTIILLSLFEYQMDFYMRSLFYSTSRTSIIRMTKTNYIMPQESLLYKALNLSIDLDHNGHNSWFSSVRH